MGKSVCFRTFIISFIVGTIGVVLGRFNINLPLFIDTAFTAVPFYSFGYFLRKKTTFLQNNTYSKYYVLLSIILFVATFFLARPIDMRTNFSKNVASLYVCGVMGTLSILFLTKKIIHLPIISYFGRYSICILLTHMPIFGLIKKIFGLLISDTETCDILNSDFIPALFVLFSYIYIIPLMVKYMPHICAQKDIFFFKKIQ